MNDNSPKMTLEAKLVQTLKDDKLYALLGDEDALAELCERAIKEALWQQGEINEGYGRSRKTDSLAVAAAKEVASKVIKTLIDKIAAELLADEKIRKAMQDAMIALIPEVMKTSLREQFAFYQASTATASVELVQQMMRDKVLGP